LKITDKQRENHSVAPNVAILARAYAYRNEGSQAYAIYFEDYMIGLVLWRNRATCYILDQFMISEEYQGKGFGKEAINLIIDKMKEEGKFNVVELGCSRDNVGAMKFYESCGFYYSGDDYEDEIGMAFDLNKN
jgi:diamine N-acetyltransferase